MDKFEQLLDQLLYVTVITSWLGIVYVILDDQMSGWAKVACIAYLISTMLLYKQNQDTKL